MGLPSAMTIPTRKIIRTIARSAGRLRASATLVVVRTIVWTDATAQVRHLRSYLDPEVTNLATHYNNPRCDKQLGICVEGEVRLLPTGGDSNVIVCKSCYQHEIDWRASMNAPEQQLPAWESLKVYETS